jgi:hypothetical protein
MKFSNYLNIINEKLFPQEKEIFSLAFFNNLENLKSFIKFLKQKLGHKNLENLINGNSNNVINPNELDRKIMKFLFYLKNNYNSEDKKIEQSIKLIQPFIKQWKEIHNISKERVK